MWLLWRNSQTAFCCSMRLTSHSRGCLPSRWRWRRQTDQIRGFVGTSRQSRHQGPHMAQNSLERSSSKQQGTELSLERSSGAPLKNNLSRERLSGALQETEFSPEQSSAVRYAVLGPEFQERERDSWSDAESGVRDRSSQGN